jgi:hypothetical protein
MVDGFIVLLGFGQLEADIALLGDLGLAAADQEAIIDFEPELLHTNR